MAEKSELEMTVRNYFGTNRIHFERLFEYVEGAKNPEEKFFMLGSTADSRTYHFRGCSLNMELVSPSHLELRLAGKKDEVANLEADLQRVIMDANFQYYTGRRITFKEERFR